VDEEDEEALEDGDEEEEEPVRKNKEEAYIATFLFRYFENLWLHMPHIACMHTYEIVTYMLNL